jgi:hypothetical protein
MKEKPILMSGPMVRAILEGRKTQTRRIVKPQPVPCSFGWELKGRRGAIAQWGERIKHPCMAAALCPYGGPGDFLWVKETCFPVHKWRHVPLFAAVTLDWMYRADYEYREALGKPKVIGCHKWTPSILMPRRASRITLEVTAVRVERLQDISEEDAFAEGASDKPLHTYKEWAWGWHRHCYESLWESINGPGSWKENPWVWAITFKRIAP